MRRRHHREHAAFGYRKPTFPSDRQRRSQNFERIVPCAVQDVREPEVEVGEDSPILVARALGVVHRLPAVRQCRRCLARDLTAKDVNGVRDGERHQLLRRARELDHPVELGCALARMPRQAQGSAVQTREAEARAKPDSIGAEAEISPSEPETLLRNGKALAEPPGIQIGSGTGRTERPLSSRCPPSRRRAESPRGAGPGPLRRPRRRAGGRPKPFRTWLRT